MGFKVNLMHILKNKRASTLRENTFMGGSEGGLGRVGGVGG